MNSRTNFMMHSCAVTHPNLYLSCFISVIVRKLLLRRTMNIYNANECIVVTYLFKEICEKDGTHKKNIIV